MHNADYPDSSISPEVTQYRSITLEDRARTSGPGLRAFLNISDQYDFSEEERIAILGNPDLKDYQEWTGRAGAEQPVTLPSDTLLRISAILGIYGALTSLFEDKDQALIWLRGPHQGQSFDGASPMSRMLNDGQEGLMYVRGYLDAWLAGNLGPGAPVGNFDTEIRRSYH